MPHAVLGLVLRLTHSGPACHDSAVVAEADPAAGHVQAVWVEDEVHGSSAGGCSRPVRLAGRVREIDPATGELVTDWHTDQAPDGVLYTACGDRRASVCPSCAETYRADTYQLIRAGLAGGKGVPESVATHPCVFGTFTAPSFGPVHTRALGPGGKVQRCRPRRTWPICQHGRPLSCDQRHKEDDASLGKPLCADCYDYNGAVVWNAHAPVLWRRTTIALRRHLGKLARPHKTRIKLSYAKVAEFQTRGLVHFHAIIRLDGYDPNNKTAILPPPAALTAAVLSDAIRQAAAATWFATVPHAAKPRGWDIAWGRQLDIRTVRMTTTGQITGTAVAAYLAKYATKSTEAVGTVAARITTRNIHAYANPTTHHGRLIRAAWNLGNHPHADFRALRRWAHMLGFRGHFATKSHRYSTTMRALRTARTDWRRRQARLAQGHHDEPTTLIVGTLAYTGTGWRTTGDELLARSAAARAREHHHTARQETAALP
jgi:hypothetical protein